MIMKNLKAADIEYIEDMNCIIQHWKGYSNSKEFREVINKSIEIFQEKKTIKSIISDAVLLGVVKKEDTDWIAKEANSKLIRYGLSKIAFVVPKNAFAQLAVDNFNREAKTALAIRYFQTINDAKKWINE